MVHPAPRRLCAFVPLTLVAAWAAADDQLYFAEITPGLVDGHVSRVNLDGTGLTRLVQVGGGLRSIAHDPAGHKVYWTDVNNFVIARANLDGSNPEVVLGSNLIFPAAIAIDPAGRMMYWLDQDNWMARANLDGSGFEIISDTVTHRGIDLDGLGKVYWSTSDTMFKGKILRANLDGSQVQLVVNNTTDPEFKPNAIALDVAGGKIYWTDYVVDVVRRSNLDGTGVEILWAAGANHNPRGIALDLAHGKMYWGQDNDFKGSSGRIMRANLDGTRPEIVINDIGLPNYLVLVPERVCYPDCDTTTGPGALDIFDFLCFQNRYDQGAPYACDCDTSTGPGVCDVFDFLCFQNAYDAGCP